MTARIPLVQNGGMIEQLQAGDTLSGVTGLPASFVMVSQLSGIHGDSSMATPGSGTDDTSTLQTALGSAGTTTPITLVFDVSCKTTGLNVRSNTRLIFMPGCGLNLANGSNRPIIRNANPSASTVTDTNIEIWGGIFEGNASNQTSTVYAGENDAYVQGIAWYGVTNLLYDHVTVQNAYQYAAAHSLCTNVIVRDCNTQQGLGSGRDGFHFFGGCTTIRGWGNKGQTGSDFFAFNSTDYIGLTATWVKNQGDITDVIIGDTSLQASANGIGILSADHNIDDFTVRGLHGTCRDYALSLWNAWTNSDQGGHIKRVTVDNLTACADSATPVATHPCIVSTFNPSGGTPGATYIESAQFSNTLWDNSQDTRPWMYIDAHTTIDVLHISSFVVNERTGRATPGAIIENHGTIGMLIIDGFVWNRPGESMAGYIVNNAGTITTLSVKNSAYSNIQDVLSNSGTVTSFLVDTVPFEPSNYGGLTVWLDATKLSGTDGSNVTSWTDESGNSNHAVTGVAPILKLNQYNGQQCVRFNGTSQYLVSPYRPTGECSCIFVAKWQNNGNPVSSAYVHTNDGGFLWGASAGNSLIQSGLGTAGWVSGVSLGGGAIKTTALAIYSIVIGFSNTTAYINGIPVMQSVTKGAIATGDTHGIGIGALYNSGFGGFCQMDMVEFMHFNRGIQAKEREELENYLRNKYGIT